MLTFIVSSCVLATIYAFVMEGKGGVGRGRITPWSVRIVRKKKNVCGLSLLFCFFLLSRLINSSFAYLKVGNGCRRKVKDFDFES